MNIVNKRKLSAMLIGIVMMLCGCSDGTGLQNDFTSVPLCVGSLRLNGKFTTRAGGTLITTEGATIGVFLTGEGGYTPAYNKTYIYSGSEWSSTDPVYLDKRTGKVLAVYDPNNLVSFDTTSGAITANDALQVQPYDEDKLWYYDQKGVGVNCTTPAAFSMKCAYSRLAFNISRNANYPLACKVSRVVIKPSSGDFYTTARVNIKDGTLTGTPVVNYIIDTSTLSMNTSGLVVGTPDTSIDLLFPAQKLAVGAGLTFTLTTDNKDYSVTVPAATFNTIQAGVHYTVQLEMTGIGIVISNVSTTDWVMSGSNINSGFD